MSYTAPVAEMRFVLSRLIGLERLGLPGLEPVDGDMLGAILDEAARFSGEVLAPLNWPGDRQGAKLDNGVVRLPEGWDQAYAGFVENGWPALAFATEHGGQGLPAAVGFACQEMWQAANMAWGLCPLLTQGAAELLAEHGAEGLKARYLQPLVSGTWTGTMNLTEPAAGSDLARVRSRAERAADGTYRIHGQKIYITYGDHELTPNIVHFVLARLPDAPEGVKGISLFLVPKLLLDEDGRPAQRNDVTTVSLEHKLGIHASPTAVLSFGERGGATGWLVGRENDGLKAMFTMMNAARLGVALQGVGIADRALQQALAYARGRVQSVAVQAPDRGPAAIIQHGDVRRMLLEMRAQIEGIRAVVYEAGFRLDQARHHPEASVRAAAQARVDLLTPIAKAHATDLGVDLSSLGIQIHGGMGYVEETGAAQHWRDARITPIYEGTNGIQANDLVFRKLLRDGGAAMRDWLGELRRTVTLLAERDEDLFATLRDQLADAVAVLQTATDWLLAEGPGRPASASAAAAAYLRMAGIVASGEAMARGALLVAEPDEAESGRFRATKLKLAEVFAVVILPRVRGLLVPVTRGADAIAGFEPDWI